MSYDKRDSMPDDYEPYETNPFEQEPDEEETTSKSTTDIYKPKGADAKDDLNLPFGIKLSLVYLKSLPGILKVVEFLLLLLAFSICSGFRNGFRTTTSELQNHGRTNFFLFVTVVSWLFVIAVFVVNLTGLMEKIEIPRKNLILGAIHGGISFFLLIASVLTADHVSTIRRVQLIDACAWVSANTTTTCGAYEAATAFGFFALIAFVCDAVFHVFDHARGKLSSDAP